MARNPKGVSEIASDLNIDLMCFWKVLQTNFQAFKRLCEATPFSERYFHSADTDEGDQLHRALAFFIRARMSLAGRMNTFTGITKTRVRRGMNAEVSAWLSAIEGLPEVHARIKRVLLLCRPALEIIRTQDTVNTLFYCDPPYLAETRNSADVYEHEMTDSEHRNMLVALGNIQGKFLLSGYPSRLYDEAAQQYRWTRHDFIVPNNAAGGTSKRMMTECIWMNTEVKQNLFKGL